MPNHLPAQSQTYTKRLIALGVTVTLGFSTICAFVLLQSRNQDREQARQAAVNLVATLSSEINRNLEIYDLSLQAVVDGMKLPQLLQVSPEVRQLVLFDRAATAKDMGSIFILDEHGTVTMDSRTLTPAPENHAQRDFFRVPAHRPDAGVYVSQPWKASDGGFVIAMSRRLTNTDGLFAGVVVGTLRLSYFHEMFRKLQLRDRDAVTLVRVDGSIVMRAPYATDLIGRNLRNSPIFQRISALPSGSFEDTATLDSVERLYVFQAVGDHPLFITYAQSVESIFAAWLGNTVRIGLLMLALCATNIALVIFLARALRRRSKAEYELGVMATTDSLTGLCNRRRLDEMFHLEWRRAMQSSAPLGLLMIDADRFKNYNDLFGHQAGDDALATIARCIEGNVGQTGICARYGGEEIAVLLPGTPALTAFDLAEKIRGSMLAIREQQQGRADAVPTVSIGVAAIIPRHGLHPKDLIKAADIALYEAKSRGRNRSERAPLLRPVDAVSRRSAA